MTFDMATATSIMSPIFNYFVKMWWVLVYEKSIWLMGFTVSLSYIFFPLFDVVVGLFLGS